MTKPYDVILVGAGMVGLTLAAQLVQEEWRVLILEKASLLKKPWHLPSLEGRVSAIHPASQKRLAQLGCWDPILSLRVSAYEHMHVWDEKGTGAIDFDAHMVNAKILGYILENDVMTHVLLQHLKKQSGVTIKDHVQLNSLEQHSKGWRVNTEEGVFEGILLVGADGAHSWVRKETGIECSEKSYDQEAIVATITTEKSHEKTAWQRFLSTGPLAFLPLKAPHHCSIVWSLTPEMAKEHMEQSEDAFCKSLTDAFQHRLGEVTSVGPRNKIPLYERHAKSYVKEKLVLVGDAAHTIHPLAGQGVHLGLCDGDELVKVLKAARDKGKPLGRYEDLRAYERARRTKNQEMMLLMAAFKQIFQSQNPALVWLRNIGLKFADPCTPLKRFFIRYGMGD